MNITLHEPIMFGSRTITELEFREPKAKDMRQLKAELSYGDLLDLAGVLSGEPRSVIDLLSARDAHQVCGLVGNALAGGGETSPRPSPSLPQA